MNLLMLSGGLSELWDTNNIDDVMTLLQDIITEYSITPQKSLKNIPKDSLVVFIENNPRTIVKIGLNNKKYNSVVFMGHRCGVGSSVAANKTLYYGDSNYYDFSEFKSKFKYFLTHNKSKINSHNVKYLIN